MTGSALAPVIIPIVAVAALAVWLAMVYYADAHPGYRTPRTARKTGTAHADTAAHPVRPDGKAPQDGDDADGERARTATTRRAA